MYSKVNQSNVFGGNIGLVLFDISLKDIIILQVVHTSFFHSICHYTPCIFSSLWLCFFIGSSTCRTWLLCGETREQLLRQNRTPLGHTSLVKTQRSHALALKTLFFFSTVLRESVARWLHAGQSKSSAQGPWEECRGPFGRARWDDVNVALYLIYFYIVLL